MIVKNPIGKKWFSNIIGNELAIHLKTVSYCRYPLKLHLSLIMESSDETILDTEQIEALHPNHKKQENKAILLLLFFSFLMLSLPFGAFFATKLTLRDFGITGFANVVWSVSAAVLTVNLIIAGYVYIAFKEQEYDTEGRPIEDKNKSE